MTKNFIILLVLYLAFSLCKAEQEYLYDQDESENLQDLGELVREEVRDQNKKVVEQASEILEENLDHDQVDFLESVSDFGETKEIEPLMEAVEKFNDGLSPSEKRELIELIQMKDDTKIAKRDMNFNDKETDELFARIRAARQRLREHNERLSRMVGPQKRNSHVNDQEGELTEEEIQNYMNSLSPEELESVSEMLGDPEEEIKNVKRSNFEEIDGLIQEYSDHQLEEIGEDLKNEAEDDESSLGDDEEMRKRSEFEDEEDIEDFEDDEMRKRSEFEDEEEIEDFEDDEMKKRSEFEDEEDIEDFEDDEMRKRSEFEDEEEIEDFEDDEMRKRSEFEDEEEIEDFEDDEMRKRSEFEDEEDIEDFEDDEMRKRSEDEEEEKRSDHPHNVSQVEAEETDEFFDALSEDDLEDLNTLTSMSYKPEVFEDEAIVKRNLGMDSGAYFTIQPPMKRDFNSRVSKARQSAKTRYQNKKFQDFDEDV